eukprot:9122397-Alexandrium_andersonii.AAC.1
MPGVGATCALHVPKPPAPPLRAQGPPAPPPCAAGRRPPPSSSPLTCGRSPRSGPAGLPAWR